MKNILTIATSILALTLSASGLYIISGGDFRTPRIQYTIETSQPDELATISPSGLRPLCIFKQGGAQWNMHGSPWILKYNGTEQEFLPNNCINQSDYNANGKIGIPIDPVTTTFSRSGVHRVKVYDDKYNIYNLWFQDQTQKIRSLYIDWENPPSTAYSYAIIMTQTSFTDVRIKMPTYEKQASLMAANFLKECTNLVNFSYNRMQEIKQLKTYTFSNCWKLTNDLILTSCTNILNNSMYANYSVKYISIPNAQNLANGVMCMGGFAIDKVDNAFRSPQLERIRLGPALQSVGNLVLYSTPNLKTIEFAATEDDWIAQWNNHPILPNWFGPATAIEGKDDEATLTPFTDKSQVYNNIYSSASGSNPRPTTLKLVR